MIQLTRFNKTAQKAFAKRAAERAAAAAAAAASGSSLASSSTGRRKLSLSDADLASIMGTPDSDEPGIDTSVGGGCAADQQLWSHRLASQPAVQAMRAVLNAANAMC